MRRKVWIATVVASVIAGAGYVAWAQNGAPGPGWIQVPGGGWVPPGHPLAETAAPPPPAPAVCNNMLLQGTYGGHMQGTQVVGGGTQQVIGVVIRTYDGVGNFTQVDNIKGTVTGLVPDRPGSGTYQVNADCSGTTTFQPGPGISIQERLVIVDGGREIRSITSMPDTAMVTAVQQRIDRR